MIKLLLVISFLSSKNLYSQRITPNSILPTELKMLVDCVPNFETNQQLQSFTKNFNESLNSIDPLSLKIFLKTEVYKFLLNFEDIKDKPQKKNIQDRIKNLISKKRRLCQFEQWVLYSIKTDLEVIGKSKSPSYKRKLNSYSRNWINYLEYIVERRDYSVRKSYKNFLSFIMKKSRVFDHSKQEFNQVYISAIKSIDQKILKSQKEEIDNLFKKEIKKGN